MSSKTEVYAKVDSKQASPRNSNHGPASGAAGPLPRGRLFESFKAAAKALKAEWLKRARTVFMSGMRQARTGHRCVSVMTGLMFSIASGMITDAIRARSMDQKDWTADYRLFSWQRFRPVNAFKEVARSSVPWLGSSGPIFLAIDDTGLPKEGKKVAHARKMHNPLAPPWQPEALQWGHPMFHAGFIVMDEVTTRPLLITVAFEIMMGRGPTRNKKRGRKRKKGRPSKKDLARRKRQKEEARQTKPAATDIAVLVIRRIRAWLDEFGLQDRVLVVVGDNSYTNRTVFEELPDRTVYVGRTRPDARLQVMGRAKADGTFMYGANAKNPREQAVDEGIPDHWGTFIYGGDRRRLKYRHIGPVFRRTSTQKTPLRLLVLKPVPFKVHGVECFTHQAFLITSDFSLSAETLIQGYLSRWSIEEAHRAMKTDAFVGKAHVASDGGVTNLHGAMAAACALLWICILSINGGTARTEAFLPLEKWRANLLRSRQKNRRAQKRPDLIPRASFRDARDLFREAFFHRWHNGHARMG